MNGPGDIPTTNGTSPEQQHCGPLGFLPSFGMSCRGRAEAFARRLQSRLRTLGSQGEDASPTTDEEPIINSTENTWLTQDDHQQVVTSLQPLRNITHEAADSFFDFDCEPESPGSPVDECEYSRLIETASVTPQNDGAPESGYICASPVTPENASQASQSSSDGQFFDPDASENEDRSFPTDYYDCIESKRDSGISVAINGQDEANGKNCKELLYLNNHLHSMQNGSSDSLSESLPPSQESTSNATSTTTTPSNLTFTDPTFSSNSTLQDIVLAELQEQSKQTTKLQNGYSDEHDRSNGNGDDNGLSDIEAIQHAMQELKEELTREELEKSQQDQTYSIYNEGEDGLVVVIENAEPGNESQKGTKAEVEEANQRESADRKQLSALDTDDDEDCRPQRVRRCSSLKTGKTPPGTPGRKKIVRFADVLGLDLADVKTFLDEIPTVPKSAYEDLDVLDAIEPSVQLGPRLEKMLMPLFQQPGGLPKFLDIVREKQVCLENAAVTDTINLTITGCVRVRNLDFHKSVHIRYSLDGWRSLADLKANYVQNSCDGFSDKFSFVLFGNSLHVGQRIEFAVRFQCRGQQFWDNNYGANYCFQCLPASSSTVPHRPIIPHHHASSILNPVDTWCGSFY